MKSIKNFISNLNLINLTISVIVALIFSLILTGFIYGVFACSDCGGGIEGLLERLWIGIVHVILTVITLGRPWSNEGGTSRVNLQPYVLIVFVVVTYFMYRRLEGKNTRN